MRVLCIGDVGVDRYVNLGLARPGGCSLNVAVHLSRLAPGFDVRLASLIGDDAAASSLRAVMERENLSLFVEAAAGATAVQSIELQKNGERLFVGYEAGVLASYRPSEEHKRLIQVSDVVMTVVYAQFAGSFAEIVASPRRGKLIVDFMDLADFGGSLDALDVILRQVDIGFFGLKDPEDPIISSLQLRTAGKKQKFVVTLGEYGSMWLEDGKRVQAIAIPVPMVVDTTGAGDAFAGAFLSRYFEGASGADALTFASEYAANVVSQIGAFPFSIA